MEKTKNKFNHEIELVITAKIYKFLEKKSKIELILLNKKEIATEIGISVPSLDKYLKKLVKIEENNN